jgi:hypothetical protein
MAAIYVIPSPVFSGEAGKNRGKSSHKNSQHLCRDSKPRPLEQG